MDVPDPLTKLDAVWVAIVFALAAIAVGIGPDQAVAGAAAVFVTGSLIASGRPPFANVRVPTASSVTAWFAAALMAGILAVVGAAWGFAMLSVAAAASAAALWRVRRDARRRGLV